MGDLARGDPRHGSNQHGVSLVYRRASHAGAPAPGRAPARTASSIGAPRTPGPQPRAVLRRALPTRNSHRRELVTSAVEGEDPGGPVGVGFELPPSPEDGGGNRA